MPAQIPSITNPPIEVLELLQPGEALLWSGTPSPDRFARQMLNLWSPVFWFLSLVCSCLGAFLVVPVNILTRRATQALPDVPWWPFSIVVFAAYFALVVLGVYLGLRSVAFARAKKTIYAITQRRLIEARPGHTKSYLQRHMQLLIVRAESSDIGDVLFTVETVEEEEGPREVKHGFIGVQRPAEVAAIMRAAFPQAPFALRSAQPK